MPDLYRSGVVSLLQLIQQAIVAVEFLMDKFDRSVPVVLVKICLQYGS